MKQCPVCQNSLKTIKMKCEECNMTYEGAFTMPRLMRLSPHNLKLAESFLLSGGNLKGLSEQVGISYPTLRKQIDAMIEELSTLRAEDNNTIENILKAIENGDMKAEHGLRLIKELNGEY
jgi:hypothetical protein